jgi:signal peptidase II
VEVGLRDQSFLTRWRWWLPSIVGAATIACLDQAAKLLVLATRPDVTIIPGFFSLTFGTNTGVAFGLLRGLPLGVTLLAVALLAGILVLLIARAHLASRLERVSLALVAGGATGNAIDRLRLGFVVDYLDVYVGAYHWPAFNLADSAISVGVLLLAVASFRGDTVLADLTGARPSSPAPPSGKPGSAAGGPTPDA